MTVIKILEQYCKCKNWKENVLSKIVDFQNFVFNHGYSIEQASVKFFKFCPYCGKKAPKPKE